MPKKKKETKVSEARVKARCIACGTTRDIGPGEVPKGDMPWCQREGCFSIMVAVGAVRVRAQ